MFNNAATIFPNPSSGKFTFSNLEIGNTVEVFDVSGKLIYQIIAKENEVMINLEGKEKNIYTYRILNGKTILKQGKLLLK